MCSVRVEWQLATWIRRERGEEDNISWQTAEEFGPQFLNRISIKGYLKQHYKKYTLKSGKPIQLRHGLAVFNTRLENNQ